MLGAVSVSMFERRAAVVPWAATAAWAIPALLVSMFTPNPELTGLGVMSLAVLVLLLWRTGEPPILFFVCAFQWLQSTLKTFHANSVGVEVHLLATSRSIEEAITYSLGWCVAMAVGIRVMLSFGTRDARTIASIEPISFRKLLILYAVWTALQPVLALAMVGGVRQLLVALANLRWGLLFALMLEAMRSRKHMATAALLFVLELAGGFLSFFSSFKTPIFVLALALPAGNVRLAPRHIAGGVVVMALALYLAVVWSAIKGDYRDRVSGYTGQQVVAVSTGQQITELLDLVGTVDEQVLTKGWERLLDRIEYVEFFALTIDFVPIMRPHEDGRLWEAALRHVFMPRLFFPDKAELESDSNVTERYTGLQIIGASSRSSSISIGTAGESYVDFAWPGLCGPAFLVGILYALLWRFARRGGTRLTDVGMSVALLLPFFTIEVSCPKLLGGALTNAAVLLAIRPFLDAYFSNRSSRALDPGPTPRLPGTG